MMELVDLAEVRRVLFIAALSLTRFSACFSILPFLAGDMLPTFAKVSVMLSFVLIIYPLVAAGVPEQLDTFVTVLILLKEMFVGLVIGFVVGIIFWTAEVVGTLIDNQRGTSMANVFDPLYGHSTSPLGSLLLQLVTIVFFAGGGFLMLLDGLFESYRFWPVAEFYPHMQGDAFTFFLGKVDSLMRSALLIASPILITMFLIDLCLGLISRFVPQLNVFFLAMPIKSGVASLLLIVTLALMLYLFRKEFSGIDGLIKALRGILE